MPVRVLVWLGFKTPEIFLAVGRDREPDLICGGKVQDGMAIGGLGGVALMEGVRAGAAILCYWPR